MKAGEWKKDRGNDLGMDVEFLMLEMKNVE